MAPIQLWSESMAAEWIAAFAQITDVLSALVGLFMASQAHRGYRRNDSRPMLFIAVGFVLALAVPFVVLLAFLAILVRSEGVATLLTQTSQVEGLLAILYALRMPS